MRTITALIAAVVSIAAACNDGDYVDPLSDGGTLGPSTIELAATTVQLEANRMRGDQEVPGPGDPNGIGKSTVRLNPQSGRVCWRTFWNNIAEPTVAHIHEGPAGVAGPIVVDLFPPVDGGCTTGVHGQLIRDIIRNPDQYYVNVHNEEFPAGAIRAQLSD